MNAEKIKDKRKKKRKKHACIKKHSNEYVHRNLRIVNSNMLLKLIINS